MQQELTLQQHQAIELLASGMRVSCVADTLGVRRETLWRWRQNAEFQRILGDRQQMLRDGMKDQLVDLVRLSLSAIERELALVDNPINRNPLDTALSVLKLLQPARLFAEPATPVAQARAQDVRVLADKDA